jgi:hypothetical protein
MRTVLSHFYNEEYLLPWWLEHHKKCFNFGILINYNSTDKSVEICKDICPNWKIVDSENTWFDASQVDSEVSRYEQELTGWKICLNTTEFLYGNFSHLNPSLKDKQYYVGSYVFVDTFKEEEPVHNKPLHEQRIYGYYDEGNSEKIAELIRPRRSIHNFNVHYPPQGGRHYCEPSSFDDLAIFYYGFAILNKNGIKRKIQINSKIPKKQRSRPHINCHPNSVTHQIFLDKINQFVKPKCKNISNKIKSIVKIHENNYHTFL